MYALSLSFSKYPISSRFLALAFDGLCFRHTQRLPVIQLLIPFILCIGFVHLRELTVNMAKSKWPEIGSKLTIHTTATKSGEENFLGRSRPDVRPRTEGSVRNQHQHSHSSFTFESGPAQRIDPKFEHPYRREIVRNREFIT